MKDLSFSVGAAEIVGLIGPNGSGKSTSVNLISGTLPPSHGEIRFAGPACPRLSVSERVPLGLARTFQTTSVFPEFSVREQVLAACHVRYRIERFSSVFRFASARREETGAARQGGRDPGIRRAVGRWRTSRLRPFPRRNSGC